MAFQNIKISKFSRENAPSPPSSPPQTRMIPRWLIKNMAILRTQKGWTVCIVNLTLRNCLGLSFQGIYIYLVSCYYYYFFFFDFSFYLVSLSKGGNSEGDGCGTCPYIEKYELIFMARRYYLFIYLFVCLFKKYLNKNFTNAFTANVIFLMSHWIKPEPGLSRCPCCSP